MEKLNRNGDQVKYFNRDQILTVGDLFQFKEELLEEIKKILADRMEGTGKRWLRSREVRKMLGISNGTLQTLRISGELSYSKLGTLIYYNYDDVMKRLEDNAK